MSRADRRRASRHPARGGAAAGSRGSGDRKRSTPAFSLPALPPAATLAFIFAAVLVLHARSLSAPFFADDYLFLDQVRDRTLLAALLSPDPIGNFFRPVGRQVWFWVVGHASGQSPVAFHLASLAVFLAAVALLHALARRVAGPRAAAVAAAFLALSAAADVPLLWCSGSQDLLALAGALAAILLHLSGRRAWAAVCLLPALLSKETVLLAPLVAILLDHHESEPWPTTALRAWPLGVSTLACGVLWLATSLHHAPGGGAISANPWGLPAALVHLVQAALGIEWRRGGAGHLLRTPPPVLPLALALVAVLATPVPGRAAGAGRKSRGPSAARAVAWAALGALPVAAVAANWSVYYYLFALCGAGLALGAWAADWPRAWAGALVVVLGWGAQVGRSVDEFQTSPTPWSSLSHVNRFYFGRAMPQLTRYLRSMKTARPTLPHGTSVFFSSLAPFVGFQSGDGPLVRWAYRDSSLHSYFLSAFSPDKAAKGPVVLFMVSGDSLVEVSDALSLSAMGIGSALAENPTLARSMIRFAETIGSPGVFGTYALGIIELGSPDSTGAAATLARAGVALVPGPTPGIESLRARAAAGDTVGAVAALLDLAMRHGLDPVVHGTLADLCIPQANQQGLGFLEALAARALAPDDPAAWRRLGMVQILTRHFPQAERSLQRYVDLAGPSAQADGQAMRALQAARDLRPGGRLAQETLRHVPVVDIGR